MKNYEAIIDALKAGNTLIMDNKFKVILKDGALYDPNNLEGADYSFCFPDRWQIHKEPKWYENIPDGGVLCRTKDNYTVIVTSYKEDRERPYIALKSREYSVIPLTKTEIQIYMDNAPDGH